MLKLYTKTSCPFSDIVLSKLLKLDVSFEELNVADERIAKELIAIGGKKQEPFLLDEEKGIKMYESKNIIAYLNKHYGHGDISEDPPVSGVCPI